MTYQGFKASLEQWLTSGRMVWGFFGNLDKQASVSIARQASSKFNLSSTERHHLNDWRVIQVPKGEARLDFDVSDSTNENSALVSYFQRGLVAESDLKSAKMMDLIWQFLEQPTFDQLRTSEQLGYVVFTKKVETRDVHALQFLIQSPKYGCSHLRNSLDRHLGQMRVKATQMADSEFETMVSSVLVDIEAKDKNLGEVATRFFNGEIASHRY